MPGLLEEGDEVVLIAISLCSSVERRGTYDGQHDVSNQLILSHANVADSDTHAENLLKLELDGGLDLVDLVLEILVVGDWGGELSSCKAISIVKELWQIGTNPWRDRDPRDGESA